MLFKSLPLFPTMNTLQEVIDLSNSKIPVMTENEMLSLLMTYHNTMLKVMKETP